MSVPGTPLTVEQGRDMVARAQRYGTIERVSLIVAGVAIVLFAASYIDLRDIDLAVLAGGDSRVPYFSWGMILLFLLSMGSALVMRYHVADVYRRLAAEQRRRDGAEADEQDPPASAG